MAEASGGENLYAIIGDGVDGIIRSEAPAPAVNPAEAEAVRAMPSIMHERPRHGATQISSGKVRYGVKRQPEGREGGPFPLHRSARCGCESSVRSIDTSRQRVNGGCKRQRVLKG